MHLVYDPVGAKNMIGKNEPTSFMLILYALAAVSGGLGGCAAASMYFTHTKHPKLPFIIAYVTLGIAFGIITLAFLLIYDVNVADIHHLILYTFAGGTSGSIALASANFSASAYFKKLGIEVTVSLQRKEKPEPIEIGDVCEDDIAN